MVVSAARVAPLGIGGVASEGAARLLTPGNERVGAAIPPTVTEADVEARLAHARAQGRRLNRMIQRPTLLLGLTLLFVAMGLFVLLFETPYTGLPLLIAVPTSLVLLLSMLPTDRTAILVMCLTLVSLTIVLCVVFGIALVERARAFARSECGAAPLSQPYTLSCSRAIRSILSAAAFSLCAGTAAMPLLLGAHAGHSARRMLLLVHSTWASTMLAFAASNALLISLDFVNGDWRPDVLNLGQMGVMVEQLVFGALSYRTGFRVGVQSWLASRGQAVTTAASIAALIGDRTPEDVQRLALQRLRAIRLDLIGPDDLTNSRPDPVLFGKSAPCQLGQIDAFISHRRARRARPCAPRARAREQKVVRARAGLDTP